MRAQKQPQDRWAEDEDERPRCATHSTGAARHGLISGQRIQSKQPQCSAVSSTWYKHRCFHNLCPLDPVLPECQLSVQFTMLLTERGKFPRWLRIGRKKSAGVTLGMERSRGEALERAQAQVQVQVQALSVSPYSYLTSPSDLNALRNITLFVALI